MMTKTQKAPKGYYWYDDNPKSGMLIKMSEEQVKLQEQADYLMKRFEASPAFARRWLMKQGFLTRTGKLPKKYGG